MRAALRLRAGFGFCPSRVPLQLEPWFAAFSIFERIEPVRPERPLWVGPAFRPFFRIAFHLRRFFRARSFLPVALKASPPADIHKRRSPRFGGAPPCDSRTFFSEGP